MCPCAKAQPLHVRPGHLVAVSGVAAWQAVYGRLERPRQRIAELGWRVSGVAVSWPFVGCRPVDLWVGTDKMAFGAAEESTG